MNWTLEVIVVPVSDVDRAKTFYADKLGFTVDHDTKVSEGVRIVQLTPPGSGCSIVIGKGAVPDRGCFGILFFVPDALNLTIKFSEIRSNLLILGLLIRFTVWT